MLRPVTSTQQSGKRPNPQRIAAEDAVREALAAKLEIPLAKLKATLRTDAVNWSDSSLGLPEPGMGYAQAIVPGFAITAQVDGAWFSYHTNSNGYAKLASRVSAEDARAVSAEVAAFAAAELDTPAEKVSIRSITSHT